MKLIIQRISCITKLKYNVNRILHQPAIASVYHSFITVLIMGFIKGFFFFNGNGRTENSDLQLCNSVKVEGLTFYCNMIEFFRK